MHKLIKINESTATRTVDLENELTGNIDTCFDDSALVSINNFEFMKVDDSYDCFIKLFGEMTNEDNQKSIKCKIISSEMIGSKEFLKVLVDKEIYYIPRNKIGNEIKNDFLFSFTRKDLIKVNGIIHDDLLNE